MSGIRLAGLAVAATLLAASTVESEVVAFLREGYAGIQPKKYWTWAEVRAANERPR